jgi:hypothetical protein
MAGRSFGGESSKLPNGYDRKLLKLKVYLEWSALADDFRTFLLREECPGIPDNSINFTAATGKLDQHPSRALKL